MLLGDDRTGEPAVVADELTARLRYFPLLAGRIEIADVTLVRPTINVTFSPGGQSNWSGLIESLAHALEPNPNRTASFSEIGIHDGSIIVHDAAKGITEQLDGVEFQVAWPSISRSFGANGHFVWHDEPVEASLTLSDFLAALTGERSGVKLRLSGAPLKLAFDGAASDQPTLKIDGTLNIESPSLREAMRWTGGNELPFGGFGRFALRAQSSVGGGVASLSNVNVELDGNTRRRRAHVVDRRSSHGPGHARRRRTGFDALCLRGPAVGHQRAQLGSTADRARWTCRLRPRSAALGREHQDKGGPLGADRGRREYARRQARRHDRRVAGLRRRRQGLVRARQRQWRCRGHLAHAVPRCRSGKLSRPDLRPAQTRRPGQSGAQYRRCRDLPCSA